MQAIEVAEIPAGFWSVAYNGAVVPQAGALPSLAEGGNCQVFAYALLRHFGFFVDGLRSSELAADLRFTMAAPLPLERFQEKLHDFSASKARQNKHVDHFCVSFETSNDLEPLDLLLFNRDATPYGAHVAVYLGRERAVHLSQAVGVPQVWSLADFRQVPRYRQLVAARRPIARI